VNEVKMPPSSPMKNSPNMSSALLKTCTAKGDRESFDLIQLLLQERGIHSSFRSPADGLVWPWTGGSGSCVNLGLQNTLDATFYTDILISPFIPIFL